MKARALHKTRPGRAKASKPKNPVVEVAHSTSAGDGPDYFHGFAVTYQLELVQCGKPKCKKWHGPYWYAYWSEGERTRSRYVGKELRHVAERHGADGCPRCVRQLNGTALASQVAEASTPRRPSTRPKPRATSA